jgi:adenylyltransferase/sulfurtransferase
MATKKGQDSEDQNSDDDRFARQSRLPQIGHAGQQRIASSAVAVVGLGALGSVAAERLVRAGAGKLILVDRDIVELSNLQRQALYTEADTNKAKTDALATHLLSIRAALTIITHATDLNYRNIDKILHPSDIIIDGTDNLSTRSLINEYAKEQGIPWIYGAAVGTTGRVMLFSPDGPCLSCLHKKSRMRSEETCETAGILGTTSGIVAEMQTALAIKTLIGKSTETDSSTLFVLDGWDMGLRRLSVKKQPDCMTCSGMYPYLSGDIEMDAIKLCGRNLYQISGTPLNLPEQAARLKNLFGTLQRTEHTVTYREGDIMFTLFADGRALIPAKDQEKAKAIYSRFIGN